MERFSNQAVAALNAVLPNPIQVSDLEIPPDPRFGDLGFPCFKLSKALRLAPPKIAENLTKAIQEKNVLPADLTVQAVGPYINFTIKPETLTSTLLDAILGESVGKAAYGQVKPCSRGKWVLEFSSPNVAKTLNIYHLRPTALGAALDRVGRLRGFDVVSINHLGDWGKQYGMLAVAFEKYGISLQDSLDMKKLVDLYVQINADSQNDPTLEVKARQAFLKLEQGDPQVKALWQKCVDISMTEFNRIYQRLNIRFDHIWGESFYAGELPGLIQTLKDKKLLIESEGAWVVPVTDPAGKEIPPCIIVKNDGATIYATRDIAAAIYRHNQFHFDRMTYIVGAEQTLHFQQVFAVLQKMGFEWASRCEHVSFGLYRFKDAKMSTRKGNFVTLESVLELARTKVAELLKQRGQAIDDSVVEAVAVGALVFHDLRTDPSRDVEFDIDHAIDFEGETGPYLQYAHTRCQSILRKAEAEQKAPNVADLLKKPEDLLRLSRLLKTESEMALVKILGQFPIHLERTLRLAKASQLATFLIDVTHAFGGFYRECQVLSDDAELSRARLLLTDATRRILKNGLALLGVPVPERM